MRTNLGDGLIVGLGISGFVLGARWLFSDASILWQVAVIIIGAVILAGVQMLIERYRAARADGKAIIDPTGSDTTLLHSPPMAWDNELLPNSEPVPLPPIEAAPAVAELPSECAAPSVPNASSVQSPEPLIGPEVAADHSAEKMV